MKIRKKTVIATAALIAAISLSAGCVANAKEKREAFRNSVVLINTFEVPQGKEAETLASWEKSRDFLKNQPGYIGTSLHQNLDANGKYRYVNIARWRSAEDFKAATEKMRQTMSDGAFEGVTITPGLFKVIESDMLPGFGRGGFGKAGESK